MARARNSFERLAADAAERLDAARVAGEQLALLPDEPGRTAVEASGRGGKTGGRPKGALGKGSSQLRRWLADRGYRMPEDVLAEMAGLASGQSVMLTAMARADQVLTWAHGKADGEGLGGAAPGPEQRVALFTQLYAVMLRATEALLPYGTPKAAPDVAIQQNVQIVLPPLPARGEMGRDVTPVAARIGGRMVPADVALEIQQNQGLGDTENDADRTESRTE